MHKNNYHIAQNFGGRKLVDLAVCDQSTKVLSTNNFYPSYFAVQDSQSATILSAKMLIGSNPTAKVLCHTIAVSEIAYKSGAGVYAMNIIIWVFYRILRWEIPLYSARYII